MAHTWKHKKDEEALERFPKVKAVTKSKKKNKSRHHEVEYEIDLGELEEAGYDVRNLFKGTSLEQLEKRLEKKKF
jgi:hypothetical protein